MTALAAHDIYAVVPAAGRGARMQRDTPKQYIEINGQSVLRLTLNRLLQVSCIKKIVVVHDEASSALIESHIDSNRISVCVGGESRAVSVIHGLRNLYNNHASQPERAYVLVHDAARPCVRVSDIERLIQRVAGDEHGGLLATKVVDTIKRADHNDQVAETIDRDFLWRAATPQLFSLELLLNALTNALESGFSVTDESSAMQHAGYKPKLVACHSDNIKITTDTDLVLARGYLMAQSME